jgi:hypothetical protein
MVCITNDPVMNNMPIEATVLRHQSYPIKANLPICSLSVRKISSSKMLVFMRAVILLYPQFLRDRTF